jgi:hypothetical protein
MLAQQKMAKALASEAMKNGYLCNLVGIGPLRWCQTMVCAGTPETLDRAQNRKHF